MPITKDQIRNHFHYNLWKYVLLIVVAVFGWNLLFTTTSYRVPADRKVEFYAEGYQTDETAAAMDELVARIHRELLPEMEAVSYRFLFLDDTYGPMQLMIWASAGEGDLYLLTKEHFLQLTGGGATVDLRPYIDSGKLQVEGIHLAPGLVRDAETGQMVQYGIPADSLVRLAEYGLVTKGGILTVLGSGQNEEEAVLFLDELLRCMREEDGAR